MVYLRDPVKLGLCGAKASHASEVENVLGSFSEFTVSFPSLFSCLSSWCSSYV